MSEELLQRDLIKNPEKIGTWDFYNIGSTSVNALKEADIIRSIDYGSIAKKKVDGIIVKQKEVIAIIENKHPRQFNTEGKKNKAILQEIEVAKKLKTKLIIATDTQETLWINVATGNSIKDKEGKLFKYHFNSKDPNLQKIMTEIIQSISEKNDKILPKELVNPTDLAKQIWQDVWSVSGATPENCLYTFVELFIFKYLSDLGVLNGGFSFRHLMKRYNEDTPNDVLQYYADVIRLKIKELFPEGQDKTTIINGTIFVSKDQKAVSGYGTVFKKVLEKFENYGRLDHIEHDFKSKLFESFLKESISKKNWGQFFTPIKVVRAINEMAEGELKEGMKICDPACGVGKFPLEFIKDKLGQLFTIENGEIKQKIEIIGYDKGFDKDEQKTIILAKANMLIYFCDLIKDNVGLTKSFSDIFNKSFILKTNSILGTLSEPTENEYDLILTNPPYVTSGSSNLKEEIAKTNLKNYYKINAMGVEGLFMEWIIKALKPGGKAFIVVPDGIFNRQNDKTLRQYLLDTCFIDAIISLPIKTFFTTPKKTYILAITKKYNLSDIQTDPIFTYLVSEIGESRDVYRFDIEQDDLKEAVSLFNAFKGSKKFFSSINNDKRCKIIAISEFESSVNWSVDRWFSKEDKIELGIEEALVPVSSREFSEIIQDIGMTLGELASELKNLNHQELEKKKTYREISLTENSCFELSIGKRVTKKDLTQIKEGTIPLYSANVFEPIGFLKKSNITDFKNNFILWGIDGTFNFNFINKETPFATTDHCGAIKILNDSILPEYLMLELERIKHLYGFDRELRSSLKNMQNITVMIPIDSSGNIDTQYQLNLIEIHRSIQEIKKTARNDNEKIRSLTFNILEDFLQQEEIVFKHLQIEEVFELPAIKGLTANFIEKNKGDIPVYGGRKEEIPVGYIRDHLEKVKYFENCLAWNREGSVGYVFHHKHRFTTNDHHRPMQLKQTFENLIDLDYMKFQIEALLLAQGFKWSQTASKEKVAKMLVKVPLNLKGEFDLLKQRELADKYLALNEMKSTVKNELMKIENARIDLGF